MSPVPTNDARALPHLEIMMPFYGDPAQFRAAVESVLAQDDPTWTLTVIDDCYPSPDPGAWFSSLDDPRLRYLRNPVNLGVSGTFQRCVDESTSELVTIMGCDDLMHTEYVGRARQAFVEFPSAAYYQPGVQVIDDASRPHFPLADRVKSWYRPDRGQLSIEHGDPLVRSLLRGNWTYFPSICWRREVVAAHGFSSQEVVLDLVLQLEILFAGGSMILDPAVTFSYRRHGASVSSWRANDGSRFTEERDALTAAAGRAAAAGWSRASRAGRWRVSSRLNAASRLPAAIAAADWNGARRLIGHALGR